MSGASPELLLVARVLKSYGTDGGMLISFRGIAPEDLDLKEPVSINFDGLPVPFFFEYFSRKGTSRAIVRLTGVKSLEDAEELVGKDIFARRSAVNEYEGEDDGLSVDALIGWTLLDEYGTEVGTISDYEPIPGNPCLYVESANGTVMVPLHDDLIIDVDESSSRLTLRIPEGLL